MTRLCLCVRACVRARNQVLSWALCCRRLTDACFGAWFVSGLASMALVQSTPAIDCENVDASKGNWLESRMFATGRLPDAVLQGLSGVTLTGTQGVVLATGSSNSHSGSSGNDTGLLSFEDENAFLRDLILRREGTDGCKLGALMRVYLGSEDFGNDRCVNTAVWAVAAAALRHSGLIQVAHAFAQANVLVRCP